MQKFYRAKITFADSYESWHNLGPSFRASAYLNPGGEAGPWTVRVRKLGETWEKSTLVEVDFLMDEAPVDELFLAGKEVQIRYGFYDIGMLQLVQGEEE